MSTTTTEQQIPAGTWTVDPAHSVVGFRVRHMGVSNFFGSFGDFDAELTVGEDGQARLQGAVRVASVEVRVEHLDEHLQSPDFFDAEQYPEVTFASSGFAASGESVELDGELSLKGTTRPLRAKGSLAYVEADIAGAQRIGVELMAKIDRTEYGLSWNAPLSKGGFALGNDVTLLVTLELTRSA